MKKTITLILAVMMTVSLSSSYAAISESAATETAVQKKPKKKAELKDVTFLVHLHCENCVKKVQENIAFEKGVKDLKVSLEDQTVAVKYDASKTSEAVLKSAIETLGYPVSGKAGEGNHHHHEDHGHSHDHGDQH